MVTLNNILVGEVWLCGGQSNMEYPMTGYTQIESISITKYSISTASDPLLHFFHVDNPPSMTPLSSVRGAWQVTSPTTARDLSAVGYFFGRDLCKALGVPVGLIQDCRGATQIETWISREALEAVPAGKPFLDAEANYAADYPAVLDDYKSKQAQYAADKAKFDVDASAARAAGTPLPPEPQAPNRPGSPNDFPYAAMHNFNGMIVPVIPYGIKGVIWYQGEANLGDGYAYRALLPTLINDWRERWGEGDFPFLFVQIAPHTEIRTMPADISEWAEVREAQRLTLSAVRRTAMVVITDLGDQQDLHPRRKEPVADRLALAARAIAYGERIEYSGPVLRAIKIEGSKMRLSFAHAAGLHAIDVHDVTNDGPLVASAASLVGFRLAGADLKFYDARAVIDGSTVLLSSPDVPAPVYVRYGWTDYPVANLTNAAGLPASPFKTDSIRGLSDRADGQ
jgi:sialate O-acetylesterase